MNTIEEKEIIIGIDLGDGEVSAAYCAAGWENEKLSQLEEVKDITLQGNDKVIPSAIRIFKNGNVRIGNNAIEHEEDEEDEDSELRISFKKAPKDINGEDEQLMIKFMRQVYELIKEALGSKLSLTNHIVYIAAPSGWDKKTRDLYYQMAQHAGIPIGGVTQESRAAFVRAQKDSTSGLSKNASKGAIVFDMGSSTLDFTYLNKNLPKMIDFGYNCGASLIEKSMYAKHEKENEKIHTFLGKYPNQKDRLIYEMRIMKEKVYKSPDKKTSHLIDFFQLVGYNDSERLIYQGGELNKFLRDEVHYIQRLESAMTNFKEEHLKGNPIYSVLMTGGASRMDFLEESIKKRWGNDLQIYKDDDPSLTISRGVAEVARIDLRTSELSQEIDNELDELITGTQVYDSFANEFHAYLTNVLLNNIINILKVWAESQEDYSIDDLLAAISEEVEESVDAVSENISEFIEYAINEATADIRQNIDIITEAYSNQGIEIKAPESIELGTLDLPDIDFNEVLEEITQKIKDESDTWDTLFGMLLGGLLFLGPIGWIIGGGGLLYRTLFGGEKSEEEKKREAKAKKLSQDDRINAYNSIIEKWSDISESISQSIAEAICKNDVIEESINTISQTYMEQYRQAIQATRVLVE